MRLSATFLVLFAIAALAFGWLLLPRGNEIALMNLRDGKVAAARDAYKDLVAAGDTSPATLAALANVHLLSGDIDAAIAIFERLVQDNPDDIAARRALADLYHRAQRGRDYVAALRELVRRSPDRETMLELAVVHFLHGEVTEAVDTLRTLENRFGAPPPEARWLAAALARRGERNAALAILTRLDGLPAPTVGLDIPSRTLMFALLVDGGRATDAVARANVWMTDRPNAGQMTRFGLLLLQRGQPELALAMVERWPQLVAGHAGLAGIQIDAEIALDRRNRALALLEGWRAAGPLPAPLVPRYVGLLLATGAFDRAAEYLAAQNLEALDEDVVVDFAEQAAERRRGDVARALYGRLDRTFLDRHPLAAAGLAIAAGDKAAARRWIDQARAAPDPTLEQILRIADALQELGDPDGALAVLSAVADRPNLDAGTVRALASLFIEAGRTADGLALFERLRRGRPGPETDAGWALLATAAGRAKDVLDWLSRNPPLGRQDLSDLYYVATDNGQPRIALAAAERIVVEFAGPATRRMLAEALLANGRAGDAVPLLRDLLAAQPDLEGAYLAALRGSGQARELAGHVTRRLESGELDERGEIEAINILVEAGAYEAALPWLERRARGDDDAWLFAYADAARKSGHAVDLLGLLVERLERPGLDPASREVVVSLLVETDPAIASAALAPMARADPASWADDYVEALRRAGRNAEITSFLEVVLASGKLTGAAEESLVYALIDRAGATAALPFIERLALRRGGPWFDTWIAALDGAGRKDAARAALARLAADATVPAERRRGAAFGLLERGDKAAAVAGFRTLAAGGDPQSPDARQLLYLWGPKPDAAALDWLTEQARRTQGAARQGWLALLVELGGGDRVRAMAETAGAARDAALDVTYAEALSIDPTSDPRTLLAAIDRVAALDDSVDALRRIARSAERSRHRAAADRAWAGVLSQAGDDTEALRQRGMIAYDEGRSTVAERFLGRHLARAADGGDFEANYFYAETLAQRGRTGEAPPYWRRALQRIAATPDKSFYMRLVEANVLSRLGRVEESVARFEALRRERPADAGLTADYGAMLLQHGRIRRAGEVLGVF